MKTMFVSEMTFFWWKLRSTLTKVFIAITVIIMLEKNKQTIGEQRSKCRSVTVWTMIALLGMGILNETVNGEQCCAILNEHFIPVMKNVQHDHSIFQHDGAPSHYTIVGGKFEIANWQIDGWDVTSCDYWLWEYLKKFYVRKPREIYMLKRIIDEEIRDITVYQKAMYDFPKRCQLCCVKSGEQYEGVKWFDIVVYR